MVTPNWATEPAADLLVDATALEAADAAEATDEEAARLDEDTEDMADDPDMEAIELDEAPTAESVIFEYVVLSRMGIQVSCR